MLKIFLIASFIFSSILYADEFSDLKKKKENIVSKNPFASNKASCSTTDSTGAKLTEIWYFFADSYIQDISGIVLSKGTYHIEKDLIKIKQTSSKVGMKETATDLDIELKFKIAPKGFDYILINKKGEKSLYECLWTGSSMSKI